MIEDGARGGEGAGRCRRAAAGVPFGVGGEPCGLVPQGRGGLAESDPGHESAASGPAARGVSPVAGVSVVPGACSRMTWALVPLTPNEETPARRGRPPRARGRGRVRRRRAPEDQSTCGDGSSACRVRGRVPVPQGQDGLDDARDTGGGLGVPDVRLHRTQPQRPFRIAPCPYVASSAPASIGSPSFVPVPCASTTSTSDPSSPASANAARMTRCWAGPFGAERPLLAPSWLTACPARPRGPVAVAAGVGEPLEAEHADALGEPEAVGGGGEGLAAAVGGQAAADG